MIPTGAVIAMLILAGWAVCVTILLIALVIRSEERETALNKTIREQAEELAAWRKEEAEIDDESKEARFSRSINILTAAEDERIANRIAVALHGDDLLREHVGSSRDGSACDELMDEVASIVLRELQNAWKPDPAEEVA